MSKLKSFSVGLGLLVASSSAAFATPTVETATAMKSAATASVEVIVIIKEEANKSTPTFNKADVMINDVIIPDLEDRFFISEEHFSEAAELLVADSTDFQARVAFRTGCSAIARAALKLGTAKLKSVDGIVYSPFSIQFDDLKSDIEDARLVNGC